MTFPTIPVVNAVGQVQTVDTLPNAGQQPSAGSLPVVTASDQITLPAVTVSLGAANNMTGYGLVILQVDGLSGGDTIVASASVGSGGTPYTYTVMALSGTFGTTSASISHSGTYAILGAGHQYVTFTKTGAASAPTLTLTAGQ